MSDEILNITFRQQLFGSLFDICKDSRLDAFQKDTSNLVELIILLAGHKEEGVSLFPIVYLTNNVLEMKNSLPDSLFIKIGTCDPNPEGFGEVIKKCAPLAIEKWNIYIEDKGNSLLYGVFKGDSSLTSITIDTILMEEFGDVVVAKIHQISNGCIYYKVNHGKPTYIYLNHAHLDSSCPLNNFNSLIESIIKDVPSTKQDRLRYFLQRAIFRALRLSHGCIVAVTGMDRCSDIEMVDTYL